ncbi:MAG: ATP-binding cassette domain-containing protein [Crocinitomicaceae bacterium]|nr:ATP-binding cassette domain-containing protein [Crocinitomicaceae bacterium]
MLKLQNIGLKRENWILRNVNVTVHQGELVGIIGESGIGKTTLLKLMAGVLDTTEGAVVFDDRELLGPSVKLIPGYEDIQLVNQDFGLEPYHTVEQNVREKVLNLTRADRDHLVDEFLELVELTHLRDRKAHLLSGGEQQRLSIARALACEPRVLLLDEPFVHIDQRLRLNIVNYLLKLNEVRNTTIVLVSHDGAEVMGFAKKVIHLSNQGIERIDEVSAMFYHPFSEEQGRLMGPINKITIDQETILFRPNEYGTQNGSIPVTFQNYLDTGVTVFNYFKTERGEEIVLTSSAALKDIRTISIEKK